MPHGFAALSGLRRQANRGTAPVPAVPATTRRTLMAVGIGLAASIVGFIRAAETPAIAQDVPNEPALQPATQSARTLAVEHITIVTRRSFAHVHAALIARLPQLDPRLIDLLMKGQTDAIAAERATGPKLWLFLAREHGRLLAAEGQSANAIQYEIGNPLTAERMTRHQLPAALYAPLRVLLYENPQGFATFEYDRPSSLFAQYGDDRVTQVGRELDAELQAVLLAAAA